MEYLHGNAVKGKISHPNGCTYEGYLKNGHASGRGKFSCKGNDTRFIG